MKTHLKILATVISTCLLTACHTMTVGIENAKTGTSQYINSCLNNLGTLYVLNTRGGTDGKTTTLTRWSDIGIPNQYLGPKVSGTDRKDKASAGITVALTPPNLANQFSAQAQAASQTSIEIQNYQTNILSQPDAVLNGPLFRSTIQSLVQNGATYDQGCYCVFVTGVTLADSATFSFGAGTPQSPNGVSININGIQYKVQFEGGKESDWQGKATPVLFNAQVYKLVKDGSAYHFDRDLSNRFKVLTTLFSNQD